MEPITDHLQYVFKFGTKDWGTTSDDAWLYGIVCGWTDPALSELRNKFAWNSTDVETLKSRRDQFLALAARDSGGGNDERL